MKKINFNNLGYVISFIVISIMIWFKVDEYYSNIEIQHRLCFFVLCLCVLGLSIIGLHLIRDYLTEKE